MSQISIPSSPGMALGKGYDSLTGETKSVCVDFTGPQQETTQHWNVTWASSQVANGYDLLREMQLSASSSFGYGTNNASGKVGYFHQTKVSAYDVTFVAQAKAESGWQIVEEPRLKAEYVDLLKHDPISFRRRCGDKWMIGAQQGAEFIGIVTIHTNDITEHRSISSELQLALASFNASGQISDDTKQELRIHNSQVKGWWTGASSNTILPTDIDGMIAAVKSILNVAGESGGKELEILVHDYAILAESLEGATFRKTSDAVGRMAERRWQYDGVKQDILYIFDHSDQFYFRKQGDMKKLSDILKTVDDYIRSLEFAYEECKVTLGEQCDAPNLPPVSVYRNQLPVRYASDCASETVISLPQVDVLPLAHKTGQKDVGGRLRNINITSSLEYSESDYVTLEVVVTIEDALVDGGFQFEDRRVVPVFDVLDENPQCALAQTAVDRVAGHLNVEERGIVDEWVEYGGAGLIEKASCLSDVGGRDVGRLGCKVKPRKVRIFLVHKEDKLTDVAALAKRIGEFEEVASVSKAVQDAVSGRGETFTAQIERVIAEDPPAFDWLVDEDGQMDANLTDLPESDDTLAVVAGYLGDALPQGPIAGPSVAWVPDQSSGVPVQQQAYWQAVEQARQAGIPVVEFDRTAVPNFVFVHPNARGLGEQQQPADLAANPNWMLIPQPGVSGPQSFVFEPHQTGVEGWNRMVWQPEAATPSPVVRALPPGAVYVQPQWR